MSNEKWCLFQTYKAEFKKNLLVIMADGSIQHVTEQSVFNEPLKRDGLMIFDCELDAYKFRNQNSIARANINRSVVNMIATKHENMEGHFEWLMFI